MKRNTTGARIPDPVLEIIESEKLMSPGDKVLAAISGGADSAALLHMLTQISRTLGITLAVAHLNHGLRGRESDGDQAFVERLAHSLGLPCYSGRTDVNALRKEKKLSLEEAARDARHGFLFATAAQHGFTKIATAHHADDNAELFLLNLFRGSGPAGLKTMGASGHDSRVIRPLIGISRKDILAYIQANGLAFRTDSSNTDPSYLRNRIRLDLLPLLNRDYQNGIREILNRTASIIRDDDTFLDEITEPLFRQAVVDEQGRTLSLSVPLLASYPKAALRRVIRKAMEHVKGDLKRLTFFHT
jgi:tRNA(Ile)-lysidine synthase